MSTLLAELQRRKVFKVGAAYLVVAWLVVQGASIGFPAFEAPPWALRVFILVLMLGFPIALVLAWALDSTPKGIKVDGAPAADKRIYLIAAVLAILVLVWYFRGSTGVEPGSRKPGSESTFAEPGSGLPKVDSDPGFAGGTAQKSIAVLAFTDLSPAKDQEYFSDGIAEEILNALVKVKGLKVAGRTSSFYYKGKNEDLRKIGETLGVAHILEGSVRKQGEKVRITAQLVQADDGFHLWSETYDGDLADVFELQERIARAITDELKIVLQGGQQQRLVQVATVSTQAYALYLQATDIFNRRDYPHMAHAIALLEQALQLDPAYARAHSRLAAVHHVIGTVDANAAAMEHSRLAMALDASLAEPHAVQGAIYFNQRRFAEQHAAFARALALEPDDVSANFWHAQALLNCGYTRRGLEYLDHVLAIDPMLPNALSRRAWAYVDTGEIEIAERMARRAADSGLVFAGATLARVEMARGRREAAIAAYAEANRRSRSFPFPDAARELFARSNFGDDEALRQSVAMVDDYLARNPATTIPAIVHFVLLRDGQIARTLALMEGATESPQTLTVLGNYIWGEGREVRTAPEFAGFARRIGLAAWWDVNGPPDLCRKADNGDYRCE